MPKRLSDKPGRHITTYSQCQCQNISVCAKPNPQTPTTSQQFLGCNALLIAVLHFDKAVTIEFL